MPMRLKNLSWQLMAAVLIALVINTAAIAATATAPAQPVKLVIIIDNLGDQESPGLKAANLPGAITCSILPHGRFSAKIAGLCHAQNKTVILNTPMQAENNYPLGPGGLHSGMSQQEFIKTLKDDLATVPYVQGLDNHMGSLLTTETNPMNWLMQTIKPYGLFFLDNKTSPHSVAERVAKTNQVPFIGRDIFLDDVRTTDAIAKQFTEALRMAKEYGVAVIVAHPYAATLAYLQANLPLAGEQGYQLTSIPDLLNITIKPVTLVPTATPAPITPAVQATAVKPAVVKPTVVKPVEQKNPVMPPPVTAPVAKPLPLIKPVTVAPSVAIAPPVSAPKPSPKKNIIELPAINDNAAPASIELTVNKDHQVVVQTVAQATKQNTAANVETIPLTLPTRSATAAAGTINIAPPAKIDKPTAVTTVAAARETAKASHSLIQTLKDSLCKKYAHFCGHTNGQAANEQLDLSHIAFTSLQGKLSWPTAGKVLTHFGAELGDSNLKYNGVLIQAPAGQPIHAIYAGRVIFANWLQGLGLLLIIDHGNGYMSLYGHNAALYKKVGDSVKPNDLIASVGDSGVPGPIGLYFEIRHNGQPVNPDAWCS